MRASAMHRRNRGIRSMRRLVRECVDWYAIEHRLAGTVVTPQMRCHWAYR